MTTATSVAQFFQESSAFSGAGLLMNFGKGGGSFTGKFLDFQVNDARRFSVGASGQTGIATATPFAMLSVTASSTLASEYVFGVADSNNAPKFLVTNAGNVGIGTTSPGSIFSVNDVANFTTATSTFQSGLNLSAVSGGGLQVANGGLRVNTLNVSGCDVKSTTSGVFFCGTDAGASGSSEINWTYAANPSDTTYGRIYMSTTTNQALIGATATTSLAKLEVFGDVRAFFFTATTSSINTFPQIAFTNATGTSIYASASSTFQILNTGTLAAAISSSLASTTLSGLTLLTGNTTTTAGLHFGGSATTTANNGLNLTNGGCYAIGGTCLATGGSTSAVGGTGAVQFANGTAFDGDATTFDWDNTAKSLTIGTTTSYAKLGVQGVYGSQVPLFNIASTTGANGSATTSLFIVTAAGRVGIGTTTPASNLVIAGSGMTGNTAVSNMLHVTGTLPTTNTATAQAVNIDITSAGSSAQAQYALGSNLKAGFTGNSLSVAGLFVNDAAGVGTAPFTGGAANYALYGNADGSTGTGYNVGQFGVALQGLKNFGMMGTAPNASANSNTNVGVVGFAASETVNVGGFFGLRTTEPTWTSAALVADNGAVASPIFLGQDNGSTVFTIADGGNVGVNVTPDNTLVLSQDAIFEGAALFNSNASYSNQFAGTGAPRNNADFVGGMSLLSTTDGGIFIEGRSDADTTGLHLNGLIGSTNPADTTPAI
ncbi:MAG: hypothetical protein Q7R41_08625, partial [Phycisphaerales bacterium]|nr:hypothetical protein [Phycisphaerales bacterium]